MFILVFSYGRTEDLNPVLEVKTASIEVWSYFEAEFAMTVQGWAVGKENNWKMKEVGYEVLYKYETTLGQIICVCIYIYIMIIIWEWVIACCIMFWGMTIHLPTN